MPITTEGYVVHEAGGDIKLETIHYDKIDEHEILIQNVAFSVCASDIKAAKGDFFVKPPMILGHEAAGIVKEVGSAVTMVAPGDKVVLAFNSCKKCPMCSSGQNPYCEQIRAMNFTGKRGDGNFAASDKEGNALHSHFFGQSSMARLVLAHENCAVKVEATEEELVLFSALGCGIQTGAGAILNVAQPKPGSTIAILGAGSVGLAASLAASVSSPTTLCIADNNDAKLSSLPKTLAFTPLDTSALAPEDLTPALKNLTPASKGFDYILDCVGSSALLGAAHQALAPRGMLIGVGGGKAGEKAAIGLTEQLVGGRTYRGTHQGDSVPAQMIPMMIGLWRRGVFKFDEIVSVYGIGDLIKVMEDLKAGRVIKPVLKC